MRYEVHPAGGVAPGSGYDDLGWFWHRRSNNSQITSNGETYTRHADAVRAIRGDIEDTCDLLGISAASFQRLYAPELVYYDVTAYDTQGDPIYTEKPLYPADQGQVAT